MRRVFTASPSDVRLSAVVREPAPHTVAAMQSARPRSLISSQREGKPLVNAAGSDLRNPPRRYPPSVRGFLAASAVGAHDVHHHRTRLDRSQHPDRRYVPLVGTPQPSEVSGTGSVRTMDLSACAVGLMRAVTAGGRCLRSPADERRDRGAALACRWLWSKRRLNIPRRSRLAARPPIR